MELSLSNLSASERRIILESVYIIENSSSVDTIIGRADLIFPMIFKNQGKSPNQIDLQESIDHYKKMYYDKIITPTQVLMISGARLINYHSFVLENLLRALELFLAEQNQTIKALKSKKAQIKRLDKCYSTIQSVKFALATMKTIDTDKAFETLDNGMKFIDNQIMELNKA